MIRFNNTIKHKPHNHPTIFHPKYLSDYTEKKVILGGETDTSKQKLSPSFSLTWFTTHATAIFEGEKKFHPGEHLTMYRIIPLWSFPFSSPSPRLISPCLRLVASLQLLRCWLIISLSLFRLTGAFVSKPHRLFDAERKSFLPSPPPPSDPTFHFNPASREVCTNLRPLIEYYPSLPFPGPSGPIHSLICFSTKTVNSACRTKPSLESIAIRTPG